MNNGHADNEASLLMSPFQNATKSDISDIMGDVGMADLFSPRSIKAMNDIAMFPKSKPSDFPEDDKENAVSKTPHVDCKSFPLPLLAAPIFFANLKAVGQFSLHRDLSPSSMKS